MTAYHKVYDCVYKDGSDSSKDEKCDEKFSEFDRLKSHLKSVHGSEWPWVCGFCDLVLLYDLEFQVHIKQHTDRAPFQCPKCEDVFPDTGSVREHLAETHMPRGEQVNDASVEISPAVEAEEEDGDKASEKTEEPEKAEEEQVPVVSIVENRMPDKKSKAAAAAEKAAEKTPQDENAVNREIAALLLNLHASRSASDVTTGSNVTTVPITTATTTITVPRPEDLSFKRGETAIDLSAKPAATAAAVSPQVVTSPLPASISNLAKQPLNGAAATGLDITAAATNGSSSSAVPLPNTPVASPYSFYPSLAAMAGLSPSSLSQMNSNYLLQNLLLGKMQQIASAASSSSATAATTTATTTSASPATSSSSSLAFPTQPLPPTQALTTTGATVLKPPPALLGLKPVVSASAAVSAAGSLQLSVPSATTVTLPTVPSFPNPGSLPPTASVAQNGVSSQPATVAAGGGSSDSNIPLLCGQIVAQLNGLLFLVHSLNNPQVEVNLQTNLTAIYARLQEIVAMVEQAKSQQEAANSLVSNNTNGMVGGKTALTDPKSEITRQLEKMKETKLKEEEKVAKHIQDYHRALLQQHEQSGGKQQQIPSQIAPLKETPASSSVVSLLKKQAQANLDAKHDLHLNGSNLSVEMEEAESTSSLSAAARRRRGRPPKNSNLDLSYSPPDAKRSRSELDVAATIIAVPATSSNGGLDISSPASTTTTTKGSASSKGIRNRVFCGECAGCLKNDDCGRCRYCQDKTKFGGQNRLRQKCLHRRCQMDTHRKRNSNGNAANNNSSNNNNHGSNNSVAASVVNATSFADVVPSQSPSPNAIYSGVDLARLAATAAKVAAEQQMNGLMAMKAAAATAAAVNGLKNGHPGKTEEEESCISG